jgi:hypothetical protein
MTILLAEGFEMTPSRSAEFFKTNPAPRIFTKTSFTILSPDWEISLRAISLPGTYRLVASHPERGSIDVFLKPDAQGNVHRLIADQSGACEAHVLLLQEAERLVLADFKEKTPFSWTKKLVITRYSFNHGICVQRYVDVTISAKGNYVVPGYCHGVKPQSLGQFYHHGAVAEMISLPENLERDRRHFDRCMFRLIRRTTRQVIQNNAQKDAIDQKIIERSAHRHKAVNRAGQDA